MPGVYLLNIGRHFIRFEQRLQGLDGVELRADGLRAPSKRPGIGMPIRKSDALSPLSSRPGAATTHRDRIGCRILLKPALVAQRTEHLTTDRFSTPAVLTTEDPDDDRPVCTESDAKKLIFELASWACPRLQ